MWLWDSRTHQFITSKALGKCSTSFEKMLLVHQELFILGIEAPDRIFKDFTNHYYNCTPNKFGVNYGSIIKKIDKEFVLLKKMLDRPDEIILHPKTAPFLRSILDNPLKSFIFEVGVISHYISDLHQPLHTDGKDRFADEETVHKIMEADTRAHLQDLKITLKKKRLRIKEPFPYFEDQIYKINKNYDMIIDNYYLKKGKVRPKRWKRVKPIVEFCLSKAAQNVANVILDLEDAPRIFKKMIRHTRLLKKIKNKLDYKNYYKILSFDTGTLSIRNVYKTITKAENG